MTSDQVKSLRNTLKAGKNLPLRVFINNTYTAVDESRVTQFTIWDDKNCILYSYRLTDMQSETLPSNASQAVSLAAIHYDAIEGMELACLPLSDLPKSIEFIKDSGVTISDGFKDRIIKTYNSILNPDRIALSREDINDLTGSNLNTKDDYYNGKFTEPFKETVRYRDRNAKIDKSKEDD